MPPPRASPYAVGLDRVVAMAKKLGFGDLPMYPSIVLGGIEVSPLQLARRLRDHRQRRT